MGKELSFQLLDISYEISNNKPIIMLWGRDRYNKRVTLTYSSFRPYFYLLLDEKADEEKIIKSIYKYSKQKSPILGVESLTLNYLGKPKKVLKITTTIPESVREYRETLSRIEGVKDVLEADIRFSMRFLLDKNLYPMRWYKASVNPIDKNPFIVDELYEINGDIVEDQEMVNVNPLEGLRIMAFDIEVYNPRRTPDPSRDPIIMISIRHGNEKDPIVLEAIGHDDSSLIQEFVELIKKEDPDIIVGYNQNKFDWPYLIERAKKHGIRLDVGRKNPSPPNMSVFGHYSIQGRLNVDLYDFAEELQEIKFKSLVEVSDYLGVMPKDKRVNIEWWQISEYWDDLQKRPTLKRYSMDDVNSTIGLASKFLPFGAQLSIISGLPMDQVMAASVAFRLEARLMREAKKKGELMPNRAERQTETYVGGVVLKPHPGIHENVAVLDFASMYPSIMVRYNVGPDTIIEGEGGGCKNIYTAPEVNQKFCGDTPGFMKQVLQRFLRWRKEIKERMKSYEEGTSEYNLLNERQRAIKVLANASYGYLGWAAARWYCRGCAEAITAWGRDLIRRSIAYAKSIGLKVYYGDTDSLFVSNDGQKIQKVIDFVSKEMEFEIKIDKVYKRIFFTEAKKRYAGLLSDGRIDIVGFEAARGDWSELSKEVQTSIAKIVLRTGDPKRAVEYVKEVIDNLKNRKIGIDKLIVWKTLTKDISKYEAETPHTNVAKIMERMGYKVSPGNKIGYVIIKGPGSVSKKARPYFTVSISDIDDNYYIDKQIIPAALRILSYFGITEKELKTGTRQPSLFDFFGSS
ncbi:MAG: DNA polymerase II [Caldisphaeraceae archaeon]|nr:DNA polymerase II [Caldisphaeraceae archaeon]MEB3692599.1 DNA polymerase II [Caldisphaeraceae archaeon]MEB3797520.1 DNA polymerase II [Caldisphaeraceae archaeon]